MNFTSELSVDFGLLFNPFMANAPILHPLKKPENHWFSGVFRGYKIGAFVRMN